MQQVIAVGTGFDGIVVRNPGDAFGMPDGVVADWFRPADQGAFQPKNPPPLATAGNGRIKRNLPAVDAQGNMPAGANDLT